MSNDKKGKMKCNDQRLALNMIIIIICKWRKFIEMKNKLWMFKDEK